MTDITTIEDCLELVAGLKLGPKIQVDSSDVTIMHSIARQVFKGTSLTDRQYDLMKTKLLTYKEQFINLDCDFEFVINQLRQPLRQIDRSKYIRTVNEDKEKPLKNSQLDVQWFKVRFPFKKSLIMSINQISYIEGYFHQKGSHEHFFELTDKNIYIVIGKFLESGFEIEEDLLSRYKEIAELISQKYNYIPHFNGNSLENCSTSVETALLNEIQDISKNNFVKIADRHIRHGYSIKCPQPNNLVEKVAFRKNPFYHNDPRETNLDFILDAVYRLDRFPLLVLIEETSALEQLYKLNNYFRDLIPKEKQSVLFRLEGTNDFNQYVKDKELNNWVDESTKIVYINTKSFPKVLLKNNWKPVTMFSFTSSFSREITAYVNFYIDLQIVHENEISPFRRYSKIYG